MDSSNKKLLNLTKEQYEQFERLGSEVLDTLEAAFETGDPVGIGLKGQSCISNGLCLCGRITASRGM